MRRLTEYCDYGMNLEHMLHERLVFGIQHERIQQQLLSEGDSLTLKKALDIATVISSSRTTDGQGKFESINTV